VAAQETLPIGELEHTVLDAFVVRVLHRVLTDGTRLHIAIARHLLIALRLGDELRQRALFDSGPFVGILDRRAVASRCQRDDHHPCAVRSHAYFPGRLIAKGVPLQSHELSGRET
jgi:hypothetical protein